MPAPKLAPNLNKLIKKEDPIYKLVVGKQYSLNFEFNFFKPGLEDVLMELTLTDSQLKRVDTSENQQQWLRKTYKIAMKRAYTSMDIDKIEDAKLEDFQKNEFYGCLINEFVDDFNPRYKSFSSIHTKPGVHQTLIEILDNLSAIENENQRTEMLTHSLNDFFENTNGKDLYSFMERYACGFENGMPPNWSCERNSKSSTAKFVDNDDLGRYVCLETRYSLTVFPGPRRR